MSDSKVRSVLGDIDPEELGPTHGHEHVLFSPGPGHGQDLRRTEADRAVEELSRFRHAGGGGLIDATVAELGRDPASLAGVSAKTGVHVVVATGHTSEEWWWPPIDPRRQTPDELAEEMTSDLMVGMDDTPVRAGIIKIGTSLDMITQGESLVMEAASVTHAATGACITTHTTAGTVALQQATALIELGVAPSRLCIGHLDRRLVWEEHLSVARTGVYMGYDQICKERHAPDVARAEFVARLVEKGYGDRILLASDLARRSDLPAWGGSPGLTYLLESFAPVLQAHGLTEETVARMLVDNPHRFLAWA